MNYCKKLGMHVLLLLVHKMHNFSFMMLVRCDESEPHYSPFILSNPMHTGARIYTTLRKFKITEIFYFCLMKTLILRKIRFFYDTNLLKNRLLTHWGKNIHELFRKYLFLNYFTKHKNFKKTLWKMMIWLFPVFRKNKIWLFTEKWIYVCPNVRQRHILIKVKHSFFFHRSINLIEAFFLGNICTRAAERFTVKRGRDWCHTCHGVVTTKRRRCYCSSNRSF